MYPSNIPISAIGYSDAPWNHPSHTVCEECGGTGNIYSKFDDEGNEERIDYDAWSKLSPEEREEYWRENCRHCDGYGRVY